MEQRFLNERAVFPGKLHIYNVERENVYTIVTDQATSKCCLSKKIRSIIA